jgi:DNA-binding GntR family transcriptional regulator
VAKARANSGPAGAAGHAAIAARLRDRIVDGQFAPGARITEREVSALFGCSASAVREVFHLLEKEGAITLSARRGARVVDAQAAPPGDVQTTWDILRVLLAREVERKTNWPPADALPDDASRATRLKALEARLHELGEAIGNRRLTAILARVAMHLAIVDPARFTQVEAGMNR